MTLLSNSVLQIAKYHDKQLSNVLNKSPPHLKAKPEYKGHVVCQLQYNIGVISRKNIFLNCDLSLMLRYQEQDPSSTLHHPQLPSMCS